MWAAMTNSAARRGAAGLDPDGVLFRNGVQIRTSMVVLRMSASNLAILAVPDMETAVRQDNVVPGEGKQFSPP